MEATPVTNSNYQDRRRFSGYFSRGIVSVIAIENAAETISYCYY